MNEFVKKIKLKFETDMVSLKHVKENVQRQFKNVEVGFKRGAEKLTGGKAGLESVIGSMKSIDNTFTKGLTTDILTSFTAFKKSFIAGLASVGAEFISEMKQFLDEGKEIADELLESSRLSNAETRETMLTWGLSQSGAYGLNKAKEALGFQSEEDYYFAEDEERQLFYKEMEHFSKQFDELTETGFFDELLKTEVAMFEFEQQRELEEAKFYQENIEYYQTMRVIGMQIKEFFMKTIGTFLSPFVDTTKLVTESTIDKTTAMTQTNNTDNSKTINIKYDNSFNNQSIASDQTSLEKSISDAYNLIIRAIS